ncbi:hypothetical protein EB821_04750 [Candidatus Marinimicrobia bacterium PRS2]|nr:hypothetical protein EB821_04750 [Candidatus Marinimicrobia bacterium PRS2]
MLKGPIFKYALISMSLLILSIGIYTIISNRNEIDFNLTVISECMPFQDAEIIIDDMLMGKTNESGAINIKFKYDDNNPTKMIKIIAGSQEYIEEIILDKEKIGGVQEQIVFFKEQSSDVPISPTPKNISYSIMDTEWECEIYSNMTGSKVKSLIKGRRYKIIYSLDPRMHENVYSKHYTPRGIQDEIKLNIYELSVLTNPEDLFYQIEENNRSIDANIGPNIYYYNSEKELIVKPFQGTPVSVNIHPDSPKYSIEISGASGGQGCCCNSRSIRVSNPAATWEIQDLFTNEIKVLGQGDENVNNLCQGRYLLRETGSYNDLKEDEFIVIDSDNKHYWNLPLSRFDIAIIPEPINVNWDIRKNTSTKFKNGKGVSQIRALLPGVYYKRCQRKNGSFTNWSKFELKENEQRVRLDCFEACDNPAIDIEVNPAGVKWELFEGSSNPQIYKTGRGHKTINVGLGILYQLTAEYNGYKYKSEAKSFTRKHASCLETIDIDMLSQEILLDRSCENQNWSEIVNLSSGISTTNIECNKYKCISKAFSETGDSEKALYVLLDGWKRMSEEAECLSFQSDDQFIFQLLLSIEGYGLETAKLNENYIPGLIDPDEGGILSLPLRDNTKLRALYIYLTIELEKITGNVEIWENSSKSFKNENKDEFCYLITKFKDGQNSIKRMRKLMKTVSNYNYKNIVDNRFELEANSAVKILKCN